MKNLCTLFMLLTVTLCKAQDIPKIAPEKAKQYVGKVVTVCGTVEEAYVSIVGNVFLNFGGKSPNQTFTAYFANIANQDSVKTNFKNYEGKNVCVTGKIQLYNSKPEIDVIEESQIVLQ